MYDEYLGLIFYFVVMKQTWSPQYRSNLLYNPVLWVVVGVFLAMALFGVHLATQNANVWLIFAFYSFMAYVMWEEAKRWQTYGYKQITIDSDNYKLIFDNDVEIPFVAIADVYLESEPVPPKPWWLRSNRDYHERMREFNGILVFRLSTGEVVNFSVQYRWAANAILCALRKCNINVNMSDVTECVLNGTYQFAWLVFIIVVLLVGICCKQFL